MLRCTNLTSNNFVVQAWTKAFSTSLSLQGCIKIGLSSSNMIHTFGHFNSPYYVKPKLRTCETIIIHNFPQYPLLCTLNKTWHYDSVNVKPHGSLPFICMGFSMQDKLKSQIMLVPHLEMHETKEFFKMLVMLLVEVWLPYWT